MSGRFASGLPHWLFKRGTQMTEKDTSEITAGNQDKIWPLSNLRYIPKKNLIPIPYKNAGKARTCPRTGGAFSAPGFSGVQDKKRWDCAAFILPKVCVANFRINCCSRWKLALRVHFITEQLKKSNRKSLGSFASDFSHWLFYGRKKKWTGIFKNRWKRSGKMLRFRTTLSFAAWWAKIWTYARTFLKCF